MNNDKLTIIELAETIQGTAYSSGVLSGFESAAKMLREESGRAYERERDNDAELYRRMAQMLEKKAKHTDTELVKRNREREHSAFEELQAYQDRLFLLEENDKSLA